MKRAPRRSKIACSIDSRLLERVERIRASTGESRSAVISRALAALTAEEHHGARVERYRQAYLEHPEAADELTAARRLARRALTGLAWDDGP
ncbi:MAG: hypothetical protein QM765_13530 [Myxococcales bacterium]